MKNENRSSISDYEDYKESFYDIAFIYVIYMKINDLSPRKPHPNDRFPLKHINPLMFSKEKALSAFLDPCNARKKEN